MIKTINKALSVLFFHLRKTYCTLCFRFIMRLNGAKYGKSITSINGIPMLRISLKSGNVVLGDNVVFNNYNDAGWCSKCSIWVRPQAQLNIGDYSGFN